MFKGMKARRQARLAAEMAWLESMMADNQSRLDEIEYRRAMGCTICRELGWPTGDDAKRAWA